MQCGMLNRSIPLLIFIISFASGSYIGINIGTGTSNLPPASNIVSILKSHNIHHVRLHSPDHKLLTALANTGIDVMVTVPNDQLLKIGESKTLAAEWIKTNIIPFLPQTNITYIAIGDEVLTKIPNAALVLVPAMQFVQSALLASNLNLQVKVSSPQSMDMIPKSFPPSTATFNSSWNSVMFQFLQFLKNTGSSYMLNAQPYYGYTKGAGVFPIEYALFRSLNPNSQIVDPNTLLQYTNMFDAMVDATFYSMQAMNFSSVDVIVTASGWPSSGGDDEKDAMIDNALVYNSNLIKHVLNGSGTPSQPNRSVSAYIYELFNEDLAPGPVSEKNWGVFSTNGTEVYTLSFVGDDGVGEIMNGSSTLVGVFCVAKKSADAKALKSGLDWACGPGGANCDAIQPGKPCYEPDNLPELASYAFNNYYHRMQASGGTCDFGGTAMVSNVDPSHGSCIFAGSSGNSSSITSEGAASGPTVPENSVQRIKTVDLIILQMILLIVFVLF